MCRAGMPNANRRTPSRSATARMPHLGAARAQRQPPRAGLCRQGRQARRFRRHRATQQQCVFRDHFCGVEMRRDTDVVDLAAAARRGRRRAGYPQAVAGGRRPGRLERAELAAADFVPDGVSDEPLNNPVARYWKAMTSGGSTGRPKVILDHRPAVANDSPSGLGIPLTARCSIPGRSITTPPSSCRMRAVHRRTRHRHRQIRCRGTLRLIEQPRTVGQFRAHHDASDLGAAGRRFATATMCPA